jgi:hypothetical protein
MSLPRTVAEVIDNHVTPVVPQLGQFWPSEAKPTFHGRRFCGFLIRMGCASPIFERLLGDSPGNQSESPREPLVG